ncbi:MdtA/MuxA family multidrug efflux RND transporter periplasmic adaptor subunit [Candidatus Magnetominusculus dajiuhuensis]|uniref:MdtA/MuxA family multidrug efflux RND transporter periplasmic adaptor subunit n=1 Tax=Candidatus Magnetominusculus dajiuhuensis TaxID=3137712 RepID=UPI003B4324E5
MSTLPKPVRTFVVPLYVVLLLAALAVNVFAAEADKSVGGKPGGKPAVAAPALPVEVVAAKTGDMGTYLNGLGTVVPLSTVSVKSRVDGQLDKVLFEEGQIVNKGDIIAIVDPRPFEIQLAQAEGQLAKDVALVDNARLDAQRYSTLFKQDSISKQQLDTQESLVKQYEAAIKADKAQVENARLQINYSKITAPVTGRTGLRQIDPGNIIHATDVNPIVVITQLKPISVIFPIAEDNLPRALEKLKKGQPIQVEAYDRQRSRKLATGQLLTIDNQIDVSTGTVRFKAIFKNENTELFPNQFVNARLLLDVKRGVVLIPSSAIQQTQKGTFVYVLTSSDTVTARFVKVGETQKDTTSIETGLAAGEQVITGGAERLTDGAKVQVKKSPLDNSKDNSTLVKDNTTQKFK